VIDLSGAFVTQNDGLVTGPGASLALPAIHFQNGLTSNLHYKFNGCPIGLGCTVVDLTPIRNLVYPNIPQPDLIVADLSLTADDLAATSGPDPTSPGAQDVTSPGEANPDVVGAGNEEIWRRRH
jgi:hypothetical protein